MVLLIYVAQSEEGTSPLLLPLLFASLSTRKQFRLLLIRLNVCQIAHSLPLLIIISIVLVVLSGIKGEDDD